MQAAVTAAAADLDNVWLFYTGIDILGMWLIAWLQPRLTSLK